VREDLLAPAVLISRAGVCTRRCACGGRGERCAEHAPARQARLRAEIARLVDAVAQVGMSDALRARLQDAEVELATVTAGSAAAAIDAERVTQQAVATYKRKLLDLVRSAAGRRRRPRSRARALLADIPGPGRACGATTKGSGQKWKSRLNVLRWPALRF
jgi:hypothetical protein